MMTEYKLVIFDLDGTILNTLEDLTDSTNYALKEAGFPSRSIEEVRSFVGNGIGKLIERAVPAGTDAEQIKEVFNSFTEHYRIHCADKTRPYEGVEEVFDALRTKGLRLAVVSNKADFAVKELCEQYFKGIFDVAVGECEGVRRKPAPDSANEVLRQLGFNKKEALYVGDSDVDIETASNAGMDCVSVSWGFRDVEFLKAHGAARIISRPKELLELV